MRNEYYGTRGCLIQLSRSRKNSRKARQIKDMIMLLNKVEKDIDLKVQYLEKTIDIALKENQIDNFESKWLKRLLESEVINKSIELLGHDPDNLIVAAKEFEQQKYQVFSREFPEEG